MNVCGEMRELYDEPTIGEKDDIFYFALLSVKMPESINYRLVAEPTEAPPESKWSQEEVLKKPTQFIQALYRGRVCDNDKALIGRNRSWEIDNEIFMYYQAYQKVCPLCLGKCEGLNSAYKHLSQNRCEFVGATDAKYVFRFSKLN